MPTYKMIRGDWPDNGSSLLRKQIGIRADSMSAAVIKYLNGIRGGIGAKLAAGKSIQVHVWDTSSKHPNGMPLTITTVSVTADKPRRSNPSKPKAEARIKRSKGPFFVHQRSGQILSNANFKKQFGGKLPPPAARSLLGWNKVTKTEALRIVCNA